MKLNLRFSFGALLVLAAAASSLGGACLRADVEGLPNGAGEGGGGGRFDPGEGGNPGEGGGIGGSAMDGGSGSGGRGAGGAGLGGMGGGATGGRGAGGAGLGGVGGVGGMGVGGGATGGRGLGGVGAGGVGGMGVGGMGVGGGATGGRGVGGAGSGGMGVGGSATGGRGAGGSGMGGSAVDGGSGVGGSGMGGSVAISPMTAGQLVITEIMADTTVATDELGEWIEIFNPSLVDTFDLFGCTLFDTSNVDTIGRHLTMPPGAIVTLARSVDPTLGFVPTYNYPTVKFSNSGDQVGLTCNAVTIDRVVFGVPLKGQSFSLDPRHFNAVDNDTPANFCPGTRSYNTNGSSMDFGTPGERNPLCP